MANLEKSKAKICYTVAAVLIHNRKVLLVKHKKLGIWLNPGGHIEENELPHRAAEREFFEETNVRVRCIPNQPTIESDTQFLPNPILTNLHWVSKANYESRLKDPANYKPLPQWKRGCEQHLNFMYVVEPIEGVDFKMDPQESIDIGWFTRDELKDIDLTTEIRYEIEKVFDLCQPS